MVRSSSRAVFDRQGALAGFAQDTDVLCATLQVFLDEAPEMVGRLRSAVASGDVKTLRQEVHWVKSGLDYIRAYEASDAASAVASAASRGRRWEVVRCLGRFEASMGRLCRILRNEFVPGVRCRRTGYSRTIRSAPA